MVVLVAAVVAARLMKQKRKRNLRLEGTTGRAYYLSLVTMPCCCLCAQSLSSMSHSFTTNLVKTAANFKTG